MWEGKLGERERKKNRNKKTIDVQCGLSQLEDFGKLLSEFPCVIFSEATKKKKSYLAPSRL